MFNLCRLDENMHGVKKMCRSDEGEDGRSWQARQKKSATECSFFFFVVHKNSPWK